MTNPLYKRISYADDLRTLGEDVAERYFQGVEGYEIIARDLVLKSGKIDLVVKQNGNELVFVVVKAKEKGSTYPKEPSGPEFRAKFERMTIEFVRRYPEIGENCILRADCVGVIVVSRTEYDEQGRIVRSGRALVRQHVNMLASV